MTKGKSLFVTFIATILLLFSVRSANALPFGPCYWTCVGACEVACLIPWIHTPLCVAAHAASGPGACMVACSVVHAVPFC